MRCISCARVFAGRLGWPVRIEYGRERDEYHALDPTYILALTDRGDVAGYARLLPTAGPNHVVVDLPTTGPGRPATGQAHHGREFALLPRHPRRGQGRPVPARSDSDHVRGDHRMVDERLRRVRHSDGFAGRTHPDDKTRIGDTMSGAGILPADQASFDRVRPPGYRSDLRRLQRVAA